MGVLGFGSHTAKRAMVKQDAIRQSAASVLSNSKAARRAFDKTWGAAARAPVFCKITKKTINGVNKRVYRTSRLVGSHAYNIAASGAAATAARTLEDECNALKLEVEAESGRAPWLPGVSGGARMLIDQFLCALAQEATIKAHAVRVGAGSAQRLNGKHMRLGWEATFESVFAAATLVPRAMHVAAVEAKRVAKKGGAGKKNEGGGEGGEGGGDDDDDAYAPPSDEEDEGAAAAEASV